MRIVGFLGHGTSQLLDRQSSGRVEKVGGARKGSPPARGVKATTATNRHATPLGGILEEGIGEEKAHSGRERVVGGPDEQIEKEKPPREKESAGGGGRGGVVKKKIAAGNYTP